METDCRIALLARLIDHAPMFPPANLSLEQALAEDVLAQESASAWMLGRLVVPAAVVSYVPFEKRALSVVVNGPVASGGCIEALELLPDSPPAEHDGITEVYVEVPLVDGFQERLEELGRHGLRAKVRCGGASTPSIESLAKFVRTCRNLGLSFKATAGLHHPLRRGPEHGFLNLLAATVFGDEEAALAESETEAFSLTADAFRWRGRETGPDALVTARRDLFASIGSCSFFEPVDDLTALGVLPL